MYSGFILSNFMCCGVGMYRIFGLNQEAGQSFPFIPTAKRAMYTVKGGIERIKSLSERNTRQANAPERDRSEVNGARNQDNFLEEELEIEVAANSNAADTSGVGKLGDLGDGGDYGGL